MLGELFGTKAWHNRKMISLPLVFSQESIYRDIRVIRLAEKCKMGDVPAMKSMAAFFRTRCTETCVRLLERYEASPEKKNEDAIALYMKEHFGESDAPKAYMMWLARAALYGDEETEAKLGQWPFYKKRACLPYDMMSGKNTHDIGFSTSNNLCQIGFIDVPIGYDECHICFNKQLRCFELMYLGSYEPPDKDGFGAELEYSYFYFDEYFCRLFVNSEKELPDAVKRMKRKRERKRMLVL